MPRSSLNPTGKMSASQVAKGSAPHLSRSHYHVLLYLFVLTVLSAAGDPRQVMYSKECTGDSRTLSFPRLLAVQAARKRTRVLEVRRDPQTGALIYPQKPLKKKKNTPLVAPHPIRILKKDSFGTFLDLHKKVLVYYYASDRCSKCTEVRQEVDEVNEGLIKYFYLTTLAQVDVALERVLADQQDVQKVPALLFYEEGTRSPPEKYYGKWTAKRILDWVRRQDGSFIRHLAAARLGAKAPLSAEDEELALKTAAENSPFVTVFAYVVPGSAKEKLVKDIATDGVKLRGTLVHILRVQEAKDSRIEVHKAHLPYDLYEEEKIIDYGPSKWSKNEIQRMLLEAQQRIIYPEPDQLVDELSTKKALATILFDEHNSDHQEYVDLFLDYAKAMHKEMVFTFLSQKESRIMENHMGYEPGLPRLLLTEAPHQGRKNVLESGSYTYHMGPKKFQLNGPFSWGAADLFFHNYKEQRLPAAYRSILPPDRTWEIVDSGLQDLCHHNLKSLLGGSGKWIFVLYYDTVGCEACEAALKVWVEVGRRVKKWTVKDVVVGRFPTNLNDPVDAASTLQRPLLIGYPPTGVKLKEHIIYEGGFEQEEVVDFMKNEIRRRWKNEEL